MKSWTHPRDSLPIAEGLAGRLALGPVGLIALDLDGTASFDRSRDAAVREQLLVRLRQFARERQDGSDRLFDDCELGGDIYLYAHYPGADEREAAGKLAALAESIRLYAERELPESFRADGRSLQIGFAIIRPDDGRDLASAVYSAMKRSLREAGSVPADSEESELGKLFADILDERAIQSVFQPIVSLADSSVFGYEALTRGPAGSSFNSPLPLFQFAQRSGGLHKLDRLAREKAIEGFRPAHDQQKIFINIPAQIIHDPQFTPGETLRILERTGIRPRQIVFEITERSSIEDFDTAKKILRHYRSQGYQIAIDDAGAGYSSLQAIAELQPDFVKIDRSLIDRVDKEKTKEHLLEMFVSFARKMNIRLVAEGIERREELMKVAQLGIHFAQGYLLGRPHAELKEPDEELKRIISGSHRLSPASGGSLRIGALGTSIATFDWQEPISSVATLFREQEDEQGAVIVRDQRPVGLMMREKLFQQLSGQYGVSLFWNRPIYQLMDPHPLVVDESLPIEQVSRMAMSRDSNKLYDYVIISREGKIAGATSIRDILERVTHERMEQARVSNPLTGLPGNRQIQRELRRRISLAQPFSVIYADLDYFKWFNDRFGFQRGDELIQYTAEAIRQAVYGSGEADDFLGHIGGDDFIVMTGASRPETVCERIIEIFERDIGAFLGEDAGPVLDREGNPVNSGGIHVSLSLVVCRQCVGLTPEAISEAAASLKKQAKAKPGSVFVCGCFGQQLESDFT
ncbi:GGDEF domain-containing protein [Paenibacillus thermoaerophilus]|uniref:GGDEF domain-containing protein n=1 Tax=Paenibacillus thermoaerophilus TaxID=1215385 RepID=A0ABW2UZ23_9BACL|nr:bifunctional diguanylate cyclase/phosphodiesterase [Paenibacillus thermoaerophilus]TMV15981.1 GGDEF domain-containing protein [Paenibacillus thermoaerophilus]